MKSHFCTRTIMISDNEISWLLLMHYHDFCSRILMILDHRLSWLLLMKSGDFVSCTIMIVLKVFRVCAVRFEIGRAPIERVDCMISSDWGVGDVSGSNVEWQRQSSSTTTRTTWGDVDYSWYTYQKTFAPTSDRISYTILSDEWPRDTSAVTPTAWGRTYHWSSAAIPNTWSCFTFRRN